MRTVQSAITIDAPPSEAWRVLTAGEEYQFWNPLVTRPPGDGSTLLVQREQFRGLLVPFVGAMVEPTRRGLPR
jgi:hypothetical protein